MKREMIASLAQKSGARRVLGRLWKWGGVMCLNYHRIGEGQRSIFDRGLWSASADAFDAQVRFLKSNFDVVGSDELPGILARRTGRCVLITFDDGYLDNYTAAFPILKSHDVRATFFVSTGFLDTPQLPWWDDIAWMVRTSKRSQIKVEPWWPTAVIFDEPHREQAVRTLLRTYKSIPGESTDAYLRAIGDATGTGRCDPIEGARLWMNWDMLREMRAAGMTIGGHTVSHPVLAQVSRERQKMEISGCGQRIKQELNEPMLCFSYPNGNLRAFNSDTRACLQECDVQYAFSYYGGYRRFDDWDDYDVRRVAVESDQSMDLFRAMVTFPRVFGGVA